MRIRFGENSNPDLGNLLIALRIGVREKVIYVT